MEQPITFEKGMIPQLDILSMPPGSYTRALNMMRDETGTLITEHGTENILDLGASSVILGLVLVGDDIAIASIKSGVPEIGVLDINEAYTTYVQEPVLGFTSGNKVHMEARINYKGERIIYIAGEGIKLRSINLDSIPDTDFDKETSLFLEYDLPQVNLEEVTTGGRVLSGAYQFAARLVTSSNNTTAFGPLTGVIPIGVGTIAEGRKNIDGAEPQTITSNSIVLNVGNIDPAFEFIEPCVITYIGQSNQLSIKSLGKIQIAGRSEFTIAYSGQSDEGETILEEELNIDSTFYESAKYIEQKDSTLLIAGLAESENTTDWQAVANSIVMKYVENPIEVSEDINMVRSDGATWDSLSDEQKRLYASNLGDVTWTDTALSGNFEDYKNPKTCEQFKGYRRDEVYSFTFTPIFNGGRRGNAYHIPALTSAEVQELGETTDNLLNFVETANFQYGTSFGSLVNQKVRYHKMPNNVESPFFTAEGNQQFINALGVRAKITLQGSWIEGLDGYIIGRENRVGKETVLAQGFCKDIYSVRDNAYAPAPSYGNCEVRGTDSSNLTSSSQYHTSIVTFHSPDLLTDKNISFIPNSLEKIQEYDCKYAYAGTDNVQKDKGVDSLLVCNPGLFVSEEVPLVEGLVPLKTESQSPDDNSREGPNNSNLSSTVFDIKLEYRRQMGCVALKSPLTIPRNRDFIERWQDEDDRDAGYILYNANNFNLELYNLKLDSSDYYGDVFDKIALPVKTVLFGRDNINPITGEVLDQYNTVCFEGDTFISRYAITLRTTGPFYGTIGDEQNIPYSDVTVYLMVESNNNYNYRHYNVESETTAGSVPYYPKYRVLYQEGIGINNFLSSLGNAELYNKQYSAQNTLKSTFTKSVGEEQITQFPNRIAYSATSIEGEKFDAYRLFLVSNYHDIPKQFGTITGLFVQGNDLYSHTERSLWRCFYNTLATQATSEGDIVLGNGGAFPRPSIPILTVDGGYAGCKDICASVGTPSGRYFIDAFRSKVYYLGEGLKEVSNPAIFQLLRDRAYNKDFTAFYDYGRKRVILASDSISLSYKPELNSFSSEHGYDLSLGITRDIKDYIVKGQFMDFYSSKVVGRYFGETKNSSIKFPIVISPTISKRFISLYGNITSFNPVDMKYKPFEFFDQFLAHSYERNTGWNSLIKVQDYLEEFEELGQVFVHKANNKFRMAFPPDLVYDVNEDIFEASNLKTHANFTDEDRLFLPDLTDNHLQVEFIQDNINQRLIKVNSFIINFEQNIT